MPPYIVAPLAGIIAVIFGTLVGNDLLKREAVFSRPVLTQDGKVAIESVSTLVMIYVEVLLLALFGLGTFFLPALSKDKPMIMLAGMVASVVGLFRVLSRLNEPGEKICRPLLLAISAGAGMGAYTLFTAPGLFAEKLGGSSIPEAPFDILLTLLVVGLVSELLSGRVSKVP